MATSLVSVEAYEDERTGLTKESFKHAFLDNLPYSQGKFPALATLEITSLGVRHSIRVRRFSSFINARFLDEVRIRFFGDEACLARLSLIDEHGEHYVRMAPGLRG